MEKSELLRSLARSRAAQTALTGTIATAALGAIGGFLDPISLLITVGGALALACVTFSRSGIHNAWRQLCDALGDELDPEVLIAAIKRLARVYRVDGTPALERAAAEVADPFLRKAIDLALVSRDSDELGDALAGEMRARASQGEAARHVLVTLGKLFPAFGLIGTLIGLVLLLRGLANTDLPAVATGLGIAVLTTLYGVILANVVVLPITTKLQAHLTHRALVMQMIIQGTLLVHRGEYPSHIERVLRNYMGMGTPDAADPRTYLRLATRAA